VYREERLGHTPVVIQDTGRLTRDTIPGDPAQPPASNVEVRQQLSRPQGRRRQLGRFGSVARRQHLRRLGERDDRQPVPGRHHLVVPPRARPVGAVAYLAQHGDISDDEVLFNYDLVLPPDFTPLNTDGEVAGFELWPLARVKSVLADTDDFLFDVALSLIDFLVRNGVVGPSDPDYIEIAEGLWSAPAEADA